MTSIEAIPVEVIERKIYLIRGCKVMLDSDLAELYQVPTKVLNQAVRRNLDRFPADFMFQLHADEPRKLEVTDCDLKRRTRRAPLHSLRFHRARSSDAFFRSVQRSRH